MARKHRKLKKLQRRLAAVEVAGGAPAVTPGGGFLSGLTGLLPPGRNEQFLVGLALGAAGAWVLSDAELRGKIMKSAIRLWAGMAAGVEEMKEQAEDIKAELAAEQAEAGA